MQCSAYFASSTRWRSWPSFSGTVVEFSLSTLVKLLWRHSSVAKQNNGWKEMKGYERKNGTKQIRPRSYRIKKDQTRSTMWNFVASHCSSLFRFVVRWWWILHKSSWSSAQLSKEHSGCGFSLSLWHGSLDTTTTLHDMLNLQPVRFSETTTARHSHLQKHTQTQIMN